MVSRSKLLFTVINIFIIFSLVNGAKLARKQKPNVVLADNAFCENLSSAFYVSDNTNVVGTNVSAIVRNVTETRCLELCTNNHDAKGRLVFCASVAYETKSSTCFMYRKSSAPDGELAHRSESGKRFFEKFCLAEDLPAECAGKQFVRVDEYILKGYAQATAVVSTLAECVAHCIREKEFQCKSAMYFYEEGECITNVESAITQPDDFMKPDDDDKVIFFHNGCVQHIPTTVSESEDEANQVVSTGGAEIAASEDEPSKEVKITEQKEQIPDSSITSVRNVPETSQKSMDTTPSTTTTTTVEAKVMELKSSKLSMKKKIHSVSTTNAEKQSMSASHAQDDETDAAVSKNIQTRLYGARQLKFKEKSADGSFSFQEKSDFTSNNTNVTSEKSIILANGKDAGPEHPPSGQIVVEDVISNGANQSGNVDETAEPKSGQENSEKPKKRIAAPPGVAPPHTEFSLGVHQGSTSDMEVEHHPNLSAILTSTKSAPRAAMPKILIDQQNQQKIEQQKKQQDMKEKKQDKIEHLEEQQKEHRLKEQEAAKEKFHHKNEQQKVHDENKGKQESSKSEKRQENIAATNVKNIKIKENNKDDKMNANAETNENAKKAEDQKNKKMTTEKNEKENLPGNGEQTNDSNMMKDAENKDDSTGTHSVAIAPIEEKNIDEPKVEPTKRLQLKSIKGLANEELEFFSAWGSWTPCHAAGERRIRRRKCLDLRRCRGALMQVDYCPRDLPSSGNDEDLISTVGPTPPPQSIASASSIAEASQQESNSEIRHDDGPAGPLRSPLPINVDNVPGSAGAPPSILPQKLPEKELKPLPEGAPGRPNDVWSPWLVSCQQFASAQPCKNGQMIGFESRECIAKDPKSCKGPFFRYCTLSC